MRPTGRLGSTSATASSSSDAQRFEIVAERRFDGAFPAAVHRQLRGEARLLAEARRTCSHSAVRESPRCSAAFCSASSDTTSARRFSRSVRACFEIASRRRTARRAVSASDRARWLSACDSSSAVLRAADSFSRELAEQRRGFLRHAALRARRRGDRPGWPGGAADSPAARCARAPPAWSGARAPCSRLKPSQRCCQSASCVLGGRQSSRAARSRRPAPARGPAQASRSRRAALAISRSSRSMCELELGQRGARLRELVALLLAQLARVRDAIARCG